MNCPLDAFSDTVAAQLSQHQPVAVDLVVLADVAVAAALVRTAAAVSGRVARVAAEVATAAAELASNAVRHGGAGVLTVERRNDVLIVTVVDRGAGAAAALQALVRGNVPRGPTRGGLGHGIAAVARLMSGLEFSDRVGGGVIARAWRDPS